MGTGKAHISVTGSGNPDRSARPPSVAGLRWASCACFCRTWEREHRRGERLLSRALYEVGAKPAGPQGKPVSECVASAPLSPAWVRWEPAGQEELGPGRGVTGRLKQAAQTDAPIKLHLEKSNVNPFIVPAACLPPQIVFLNITFIFIICQNARLIPPAALHFECPMDYILSAA